MGSLSTRRLTIFLSAIVMAAPYQLLWADDVERVHHRDTTVPACATEADRARGLQLFSRHCMDAVYETTVPAWREPLVSLEMFASPGEYEPVASGEAEKTYPSSVKFVDGVKRVPCGWTSQDYDDARWGIGQEILTLKKALHGLH